MRIGIFGGSFDPVPIEHIEVAKAAVKSLSLDTLFIMPAHTPPHKEGKILSSNEHRLALCKAAFSDEEKIAVSDYEIQKGGTSYTYLTCRHFKELYPQAELFFVVGTDMLRDFPTWRNPEDILQNATLAVCARNEQKGWSEKERKLFYKRFQKDFALVKYNGKPVSSTKIRVLAAAGEDLTDFVTKDVNRYIKENRLYEIDGAATALALEKDKRREHSVRVAFLAAKAAAHYKVPEKNAIVAALFHDCAKNLSMDSPYLNGFTVDENVPASVVHQYAGAFVAKERFSVTDEDVLNAIRYHTSGRENMSVLEKIIFLSDLLEEDRTFKGVERLRKLFFKNLDVCMRESLKGILKHLKREKADVYPLTQQAYEYYKQGANYGRD